MRMLGLLALASAGAAAFAPTVPGGRLALRRSHVASQRPTGARHRVVCQANAAPVTVEVDATEVEPFLAFPGASDKVRRTQRVPYAFAMCVAASMERAGAWVRELTAAADLSAQIRPLEEVQLEGLLDEEKAAARTFPLSEEELINLTREKARARARYVHHC